MGLNPILERQDEINLVEYVIKHLRNKISDLENSLSYMMELRDKLHSDIAGIQNNAEEINISQLNIKG